jgi:hypothetical protein
MSDIFISYSAADRARVVPIVHALQRRRYTVWWDRTILPGKKWDTVIENELSKRIKQGSMRNRSVVKEFRRFGMGENQS